MFVKVLTECGYEEALLGLSLSFYDHKESLDTWWDSDKLARAAHRAEKLAFKGGGHNKFLASIMTWIYVQAPRSWWSEYDTYKVATTANSSSTMHTLDKRLVGIEDFEWGTSMKQIDGFNSCLSEYKDETSPFYKDITRLKMNLPEGWLQERQLCINYMTIQNILSQREGHRLKMWNTFKDLLTQLEHPELVYKVS